MNSQPAGAEEPLHVTNQDQICFFIFPLSKDLIRTVCKNKTLVDQRNKLAAVYLCVQVCCLKDGTGCCICPKGINPEVFITLSQNYFLKDVFVGQERQKCTSGETPLLLVKIWVSGSM